MIPFCKFQLIELIKGALLYTFGYVVRCAVLHRRSLPLHKGAFGGSLRLYPHKEKVEYLNSRYSTFQPVEKGHRKVAFFLIGDSRIEGKNAV